MKKIIISVSLGLLPICAGAQLSSNPDKFLGNITTSGRIDWGSEKFYQLWNQITPENETKWSSVQGGGQNSWNWGSADNINNYAKQHNFPFKFHTLVWGSQFPGWVKNLTPTARYNAIVKWMDEAKKKYPNLALLDVVNEAVEGHQADTPYIKEALGGGGKTGYDWLIKAFELAYERWPNTILIYNDFNTFQWNTDQFIDLVRALRDAGAPVDAYGCQSHDLTDCSVSTFKNSMTKLQNALKMPMYSTEYDIGTDDNSLQLQRYKEQIPYMWEADYCAGITLWGYIRHHTWTTNGNSGIIEEDGTDRPAMEWLRTYMQSDAAKNAKSPFPGMKKEASIYIRPAALKMAKGDVMPVMVRASMATKTIEKVELYDGSTLIATMTEAPYLTEYTTNTTGTKTLKAVVTATDGSTYERLSRVSVQSGSKREPYSETVPQLPGTIQVKEYDKGLSGVAYYNASRNNAATKDGAWMEYTVDVAEDGVYAFDAEVASTKAGGSFYLAEYTFTGLDFLTDFIEVPRTGSITDFSTMHGVMKMPLTAGRHVLCLNITKGGFYIKSLTFSRYDEDTQNISVSLLAKPATISIGDSTVITVTSKSKIEGVDIADVKIYFNDLLIGTLTEAPYTMTYYPQEKGTCSMYAIATNTLGKSRTSAKRALKVNGKRIPFKTVNLPGTVEAEDFDMGGEGLSFHDSDSNDQGDANYRTDNEGVDIVKGNGGNALGYTAANEWTEYTVNVTEAGKYAYEATVSSGTTGSGFTIGLVGTTGSVTSLAKVNVPQTASNSWGTYTVVRGNISTALTEGQKILRFTINGAQCNIDKVAFKCTESAGIVQPITADQTGAVYNLYGVKVDDNYRGIVIINGKKVIKR